MSGELDDIERELRELWRRMGTSSPEAAEYVTLRLATPADFDGVVETLGGSKTGAAASTASAS
jgi:hypothetical protein